MTLKPNVEGRPASANGARSFGSPTCHPALCRLGAQMPTRRKTLGVVAQAAAGLALLPLAPRRAGSSVLVNDIHSQLNPTRVDRIVAIDSEATLRAALAAARVEGKPVCVAGGRHAMGGQQFAEDAVLLDVRPMRRIGRASWSKPRRASNGRN